MGAGDQLGAGHRLTPETTHAALALVRDGRIQDLGQVVETEAHRIPPNQTPYVISTAATSRNTRKARRVHGAENEAGANLERVEMTLHVGTRIDALGHFTIADAMYAGRSAEGRVGDRGLAALSAEQIPPIVARALLLDVSTLDGADRLEAGRPVTPVTPDDLARACDAAAVEPREGDAILLRTGCGRFYMRDNARYVAGEPGLDLPAAQWLTARGVVAIGADTMAVEVLPGTDPPRVMIPVHQHCLAEAGVFLVKNLALDALAAEARPELCFIAAAPKFRGATGAPLRPLALL